MNSKLRFFLFITSFFALGSAFAETTFSGYAGVKGQCYLEEDGDETDTGLTVQTYFAGQLNLTKNLLVRGEISVQTEDILSTGLFSDTEAVFCIDELSATWIKPFLGNTQYISLFFGNFEPIGHDVFLQRQFGIQPISSLLTESWLGLRGSTVYPFYGTGASYILHFDRWPVASGFYGYLNNENDEDIKQVNFDWRFSTVQKYLVLDFATGIAAPLEQKNGNDDVILLIDTLYLHIGLNALLGNRYGLCLYTLAGFQNVPVKSGDRDTTLESKDTYFIVEPRYSTRNLHFHLAMFNFPEDSVDKLMWVEDTFGLNASLFTDSLYIKNKKFSFGFHTTLSFPGADFFDLKKPLDLFKKHDDETQDYNVTLAPFVGIPIMQGNLHAMFKINITDMKTDAWRDGIKLNIGYKAEL